MGERAPPSDLMAWNADATRMPYRMHTEYLRQLFLDNDLAEGRYHVDGRPIALSDIQAPMFVVGTESDHVAPWRSVYKINYQVDTDVTFVLTSGGHNAGIVAPPGERNAIPIRSAPRRRTRPMSVPTNGRWRRRAMQGSWWPEWSGWLAAESGERCAPPPMGLPRRDSLNLPDAPGDYVRG